MLVFGFIEIVSLGNASDKRRNCVVLLLNVYNTCCVD